MNILAMILAGGEGSGLGVLTAHRAEAAVPFGGKYRLIDFTLSNCVNSGIYNIGVLTQYQPRSLNEHIAIGKPWDLDRARGGVRLLQPFQRARGQGGTWQEGTADAVRFNFDFITENNPDHVLILAGDHIYKMDYNALLRLHVESNADATIGVRSVSPFDTHRFGMVTLDSDGTVTQFEEKPKRTRSTTASMGIYVFDADYLYQTLAEEVTKVGTNHDFGKDILPRALKEEVLYAHPFERSCMGRNAEGSIYWRDVGTLDSYWRTHMDLVTEHPQLNLFDRSWPVRGLPTQAMPTKFFYKNKERSGLDNSLVSGGCIITDADIRSSVLFERVSVQENRASVRCFGSMESKTAISRKLDR